MEPSSGFEPETPSLPWKCSTPELRWHIECIFRCRISPLSWLLYSIFLEASFCERSHAAEPRLRRMVLNLTLNKYLHLTLPEADIWCRVQDSNLRRHKPSDLQSDVFDRFTNPACFCLQSNYQMSIIIFQVWTATLSFILQKLCFCPALIIGH